jgi:hypothetical protein
MNDVETTLRDALTARATTVTHDPDAYAAILRRRERRHLSRWARPIGAVAAVAAVVGVVAVVVRAPHRDAVVPAGGVPRYVVTARPLSARAAEVVVVDADDLAGQPVARMGPPTDRDVLRVFAAAGDDHTFYAAWASADTCRSAVYRLAAPSGGTTRALDVAGDVTGLAVSPDGRRIAYAMWADGPAESFCGGTHEIHVRDLASGRERVWAVPSAADLRIHSIVGLVWSPDGRYVAFAYADRAVHRIDTTAAAGALPSLPPDPQVTGVDESGLPPAGTTCYTATPAYLPTGELVAAYHCADNRTQVAEPLRLVVLDPVTRHPGRTLFALPARSQARWVAFDRSGRHAFLGLVEPAAGQDPEEAPRTIRRWDGGELRKVAEGQFPVSW